MARFHGHGDKVAYFFIAVGVYLLLRAFAEAKVSSLTVELLYVSIAISLLTSNVPRVVDVPHQPRLDLIEAYYGRVRPGP